MYENSAQTPKRKNLATIRSGEYEGVKDKLADPAWGPEFGPTDFHEQAGATIIGAREFLIAYNINLNTLDKRLATDIAFELREKGRALRRKNLDSPNLLDVISYVMRMVTILVACVIMLAMVQQKLWITTIVNMDMI